MTSQHGHCHCGCGKQTQICKSSKGGNTPGEPLPYFKNHRPEDQQGRRDYKKRRKAEGKACVQEHLKTHPCIECGETNPIVLDLDHRDPTEKHGSLADLTTRKHWSVERILAEIAKCDVRCANCHRIKTHRDKDYYQP